jgi:hypothetical protein
MTEWFMPVLVYYSSPSMNLSEERAVDALKAMSEHMDDASAFAMMGVIFERQLQPFVNRQADVDDSQRQLSMALQACLALQKRLEETQQAAAVEEDDNPVEGPTPVTKAMEERGERST